ncbi:MAG: hypothetical protein DRG39_04275 [Deltaproteobacteria bacterium]|nr:MAG: hypothetical protein DRG39_04275 [Deltaproteobacteria bacterium]
MQEPIKITSHFYQLGTKQFPAYLSIGEEAMIIEGGTGPTTNIIIEQIKQIGLNPEMVKYIALTHTHSDHIGAIPRLKKIWPQVKVIASQKGAAILKNGGILREFLWIDKNIAELLKKKKEIEELPQQLDDYDFNVDIVVKEGDKIDLGSGIVWDVYETPGHSPCHLAYFEEKEGSLVIGDATGFYVPEKDLFWPNYFDSLTDYLDSIKKLSQLNARRGVLSHNCVIEKDLKGYFDRAIKATLSYHKEMLKRVQDGENVEEIAVDKANWVNSLTDIQPYKVMLNLSRLLIKRSHEAEGIK